MKKIILLLVIALLGYSAANSQSTHQLAFYGGTGLSALSYTPVKGTASLDIGGQFGVHYYLYFSPHWGVGTGLGLAFYNAHFSTGSFTDHYAMQDVDGKNFEFRIAMNRYDEKQQATFLEIPVMARFRTTGTRQFSAAAGVKIGLPLQFDYKTEKLNAATTGFYARENYVYGKPEDGTAFTHMGFSSSPPITLAATNGELKPAITWALAAEAGMNLVYNENFMFYAGLYIDYGLNNLIDDETTAAVVEYNAANPQEYKINSVLTSKYATDNGRKAFVDKISTISIGLKIAFVFGIGTKGGQP
ncbi:MAG: outer membrane beta-barrel protein [Prevotellaceae bacterium]|jgi:hypothetical protein|nr:outer membrane beta-barrel protein [Prevotellaceae bacterium]